MADAVKFAISTTPKECQELHKTLPKRTQDIPSQLKTIRAESEDFHSAINTLRSSHDDAATTTSSALIPPKPLESPATTTLLPPRASASDAEILTKPCTQVFIRNLPKFKTLALHVSPTDTVLHIKERIRQRLQLKQAHFSLALSRHLLSDTKTLSSYAIPHNATLTSLSFRPRADKPSHGVARDLLVKKVKCSYYVPCYGTLGELISRIEAIEGLKRWEFALELPDGTKVYSFYPAWARLERIFCRNDVVLLYRRRCCDFP